jgi:hypothetical protein
MTGNRKANTFFAIIISLFTLGLLAYGLAGRIRLFNGGVYVIGRYYDYKSGGSRLGSSYFYFFIEGRKYTYSNADAGRSDSLVFLNVLPSDPSVCRMMDESVPLCLTMKDVPTKGWKELPLNACK